MQGFQAQDRRTEHRKAEDAKLATMLESSSEDEADDEELDETTPVGASTVFDCRDESQYQEILQAAEVMMQSGSMLQAAEFLGECLLHFGRRWQSK